MVRLSTSNRKEVEEVPDTDDSIKKQRESVKYLIQKTGVKFGEDGSWKDKKGHVYKIEWRQSGKVDELTGNQILKMFGIADESLVELEQLQKMEKLEPVQVTDPAGNSVVVTPDQIGEGGDE